MAITVTKTNNDILVVVEDGINDDSTTSLNILGRNYVGYAEKIANNFIRQLENFANGTAPTDPLAGQLWYDTTESLLKVYDAVVGWVPMSSSTSDATAPANPKVGDLWYDSTGQQLNVWTGSVWLVVGPTTPSGFGFTGMQVESILDTLTNPHIIGKEFVDGNLIAIVSQDAEFTPANATLSATFGNIKSGYNLTGSIPIKNFNGIAADSTRLGGLTSTQFLRANTPAVTTASITIQSDVGLTVGQGNDLSLTVSDIHASIKNNNTSGNIYLVAGNTTALSILGDSFALVSSGTYGNAIIANANAFSTYSLATIGYVDAAVGGGNAVLLKDGSVTITGVLTPDTTNNHNLGTSSLRFNTFYTSNLSASNTSTTGTLIVSSSTNSTSTVTGAAVVTGGMGIGLNLYAGGNLNITGNSAFSSDMVTRSLLPNATNTYDLGTSSNKYRTIYANTFSGMATMSQYADLAEIYQSDATYQAGTVVIFGGIYEITASRKRADTALAGVISKNPGLLLNSLDTGLPVALHGKVQCRVTGAGRQGQMLISSDLMGVACSTEEHIGGAVIGKTLDNYDFGSAVGYANIVVGVN